VSWTLREDFSVNNLNGQNEPSRKEIANAVVSGSSKGAQVQMPSTPGAYRLYVYLHNKHGEAAVANVPIYVKQALGTSVSVRTVSSTNSSAPKAQLPYVIYNGGQTSDEYAPSGYMGNSSALEFGLHDQTFSPRCIKVRYSATDGWTGVVWQSPANDWGDKPGGLDFSGAKALTFRAKGDIGDEIATFKYGLLGADKTYPDSSSASLENVHLSKDWKNYSIDLSSKDLSDIKTAFCFVVTGSSHPMTFYIDDIEYR
jgi:hypothetical protein